MEKPVSLPHVRRLAIDAGFSRMRVVPLRAASAYACDYSASEDDGRRLEEMWNDTIRHSASEHARFVLHKGDDPALDSWLPSHRLVGKLDARIVLAHALPVVGTGEAFTDRLRITNGGGITWKARGRRFGGQVTCGVKVCGERGTVLREDLGRTPLPRDVAPGEEIALDVTVAGVLAQGRYLLRYDMVVEGVTWFEFQGSTCLVRPLDVAAH